MKIQLVTSDSKKISGEHYETTNPIGWVVYLHMRPATKESWNEFASFLQEKGYSGLAIDFRGHGESEGGPGGYENCPNKEDQEKIHDVEAAVDFLKQHGADPERTIFIGASIGANLALQYIAEHSEFITAVLLSPGLNYRGIATEPMVKKLRHGQRVLFVSSKDDDRVEGNAAQARELFQLTPSDVTKKLQIYETGGHGTDMFGKEQPDLQTMIIDFIT